MAKTTPLRLEDLGRFQTAGRVALAPDGRCIVFDRRRIDRAQNKNITDLVRCDIPRGTLRPLTAGDHDDTAPRWLPDGSAVLFISDRDKTQALWKLPMDGGEPVRLTDRDGHVSDFDISTDGKRVAYTYRPLTDREKLGRDEQRDALAKRPAFKHITRMHHKLDGVGFFPGPRTHVYVMSLASRKPKQLTKGDFDDREPRFNPDGNQVAFVSNREGNPDLTHDQSNIYLVKATGGTPRRLTRGPGNGGGISWSPDGQTLAYIGTTGKPLEEWKQPSQIHVVSAKGGKPRNIHPRFHEATLNRILSDTSGAPYIKLPPIWSADGQTLHFLASIDGGCHLFAQTLTEKLPRQLTTGAINVQQLQRTAADGPAAAVVGTFKNPSDLHLVTLEDGDLRQLTHLNRSLLARKTLGRCEPFTVKRDNETIHGWLLLPPGFDKRRKYPALLEIHGGPHAAYGAGFYHEMQWLAGQGYVVCFANPRGSASYGHAFAQCIRADWGNLDYRDLIAVTNYLARRPFVDHQRLGVLGGSYGGFMTNWIIGHTNRFKAAVTQRCISNMISDGGTSDMGPELARAHGGFPWENRKVLEKHSPLTYVKQMKTPLLIIHSEQDHRCPIEQAEQLFMALKLLGRTTEFVRFEGESHGLSRGGRPQNRLERLRRIADWFARHL